MRRLYTNVGLSKQAFHQWMERDNTRRAKWDQVFSIVQQVRVDHPGMGIRSIWEIMRPAGLGRDEFERLAFVHGLGIQPKKNYRRTTHSLGVRRFPNLIQQIEVTRLNQVWVSDITYYLLDQEFYYLTFIMDLYSRKIIGYSVSKNLQTKQTTLPALAYTIKYRKKTKDKLDTIFHSDGGGQYYEKEFIKLARQNGITSSMCSSVYENPHAERLNRTLKNQYIYRYNPSNFIELKKATTKACLMYNEKPHRSLHKMSPNKYENSKSIG